MRIFYKFLPKISYADIEGAKHKTVLAEFNRHHQDYNINHHWFRVKLAPYFIVNMMFWRFLK